MLFLLEAVIDDIGFRLKLIEQEMGLKGRRKKSSQNVSKRYIYTKSY